MLPGVLRFLVSMASAQTVKVVAGKRFLERPERASFKVRFISSQLWEREK